MIILSVLILGLCCLEDVAQGVFRAGTTHQARTTALGGSGSCVDACDLRHGQCKTRSFFNQMFVEWMAVLKLGIESGNVGVYKDGKVCTCDPGYRGPACSKKCTGGHGPYCLEPCPSQCADSCDPETGLCKIEPCKNGSNADHCIIQIEDDAPIVKLTPARLRVAIGERVEFLCTATGYPEPTVEWHRVDGKPSNPKASFQNGRFTIAKAEESDAGAYLCLAANRAGTSDAIAVINIGRLPEPTKDATNNAKGNKIEDPGDACKDCLSESHNVECVNNDREISASFTIDSESGQEMTSDTNQMLQALQEEMLVEFDAAAMAARARSLQRAASAFMGTVAFCGTKASALLKWRKSRHARNPRTFRQTGVEVQMTITSTFPSSRAKGLDVRSIYGRFLKDFSDDFESEILPGATIRKDSIDVSPVMVTKSKSTSSTKGNSTSQNYLLYGTVSLMGLLVISAVVLYSLKRNNRSHTFNSTYRFISKAQGTYIRRV